MNPSASGWIPKFVSYLEDQDANMEWPTTLQLYTELKRNGFIFGLSVGLPIEISEKKFDLTREESTKATLLYSLFHTHMTATGNPSFKKASASILSFYALLGKGKLNFLSKITPGGNTYSQLEAILAARLQESSKVLKKNYVSLLTYSLLYIDLQTYTYWLAGGEMVKEYAKQLESTVMATTFAALRSKKRKNKYDLLLLELFESSAAFLNKQQETGQNDSHHLMPNTKDAGTLYAHYLLDLSCLAIWDDYEMDEAEYKFLEQLTKQLDLPTGAVQQAISDLGSFAERHGSAISLFEYTHPVKLFYKQSAATVKLLILRNRKRLIKELAESGELMILLGQSTVRDLTVGEKYKVKEQLLDICKTIPSLTIFLLPGGGVLLPLLVKFIPRMLPSAFNENRIERKGKNLPS